MFQNRKRCLLGLVVCGAAYYGIKWVYIRYYSQTTDNVTIRKGRDIDNDTQQGDSSKPTRRIVFGPRRAISVEYSYNSSSNNYSSFNTNDDSLKSRCPSQVSSVFFDVEPNLHFFEIYQEQLSNYETVPEPRTDRTKQMFCESKAEFLAKVACLRKAFQELIYCKENMSFFIHSGRDILSIFLSHSPEDLEKTLNAYDKILSYVGDINNHDDLKQELATRKIPMLSFYDLVVDYIILESLDDLDSPPAVVTKIVSNTWVSSSFRRSACQSAVSTALKYKRSQLKHRDGFFAHFYSLLDNLSPTLAWGFLGSDEDLKTKCELLKECLLGLCRDYFNFDKVRYTSYEDLSNDILTVSRERYYDLTDRLSL